MNPILPMDLPGDPDQANSPSNPPTTTVQRRRLTQIQPSEPLPDVYRIDADQILDYIAKKMGIDLRTFAQSIHALETSDNVQLTQHIQPIFQIIQNGFNHVANNAPASVELKDLSAIAGTLGITPSKALSVQDATNYLNSLEESFDPRALASNTNPFETNINLKTIAPNKIYPEIVMAIYKIVINSLQQSKPFWGVVFVHSAKTNELLVAASPVPQIKRFASGGQGFTLKPPTGPGSIGLAITAANLIDAELGSLEKDESLPPQCRLCIKTIHKPVNIAAALLVAIICGLTIYATFMDAIKQTLPHNNNASSGN